MTRFKSGLYPVLILGLAACGKDPVAPPPPPPPPPAIVKLIMAPDTGFWRGGALRLSGLVRAAVTDHGDTVAAPAVTWSIPAGFTKQGDSIMAPREARGTLRASFASATDSSVTTSLDDLSARGTWSAEYRCYDSPNAMRNVENPPTGLDSSIVTISNGVLSYSDAHWGKDNFKGVIAVDERGISFWKDGVVDTVFNQTTIVTTQDTLQLALGSNIGPAAPWMKRLSDAPLVYRLDPPGVCSSDWRGGGTAYELHASQ